MTALLLVLALATPENVRVSSADAPFVEAHLAAHPRDAKRLIAAASKLVAPKTILASAFVSKDAGRSWREVELPNPPGATHVVDVWVAFSDDGIAYATAIVGDSPSPILVWRSTDGGESWRLATTIRSPRSFDRPATIARGKSVIIATAHGDALALLRSADGGRTFAKPQPLIPSANLEHNAFVPMLLPDGGVLVPFVDYSPAANAVRHSRVGLIRDGAPPTILADVPRRFPGTAAFAMHKDRVIAVWNGGTESKRTIATADRVLAEGKVVQPAVAINKDGVVAIAWIEADEQNCTRVMIAVDDQPPVWLSEEMTCGKENDEWQYGGHYFGLTSSADGAFHAIWCDARDGVFRVYSARVDAATSF